MSEKVLEPVVELSPLEKLLSNIDEDGEFVQSVEDLGEEEAVKEEPAILN